MKRGEKKNLQLDISYPTSKTILYIFCLFFIFTSVTKFFVAPLVIPRSIPVRYASIVIAAGLAGLFFHIVFSNRYTDVIVLAFLTTFSIYSMVETRFFLPVYFSPTPLLSLFYLIYLVQFIACLAAGGYIFRRYLSPVFLVLALVYLFILQPKLQIITVLLFSFIVFVTIYTYVLFLLLRYVANQNRELAELNEQQRETMRKLTTARNKIIAQEKMSSLATFTAGLAHEINNPVNYMYGNLHFLEEYHRQFKDYLTKYYKTKEDVTETYGPQKAPAASADNKSDSASAASADKESGIAPAEAPQSQNDLNYAVEDMGSILLRFREGFERIVQIIETMKQSFPKKTSVSGNENIAQILENAVTIVKKAGGHKIEFISEIQNPLHYRCNASDILTIALNLLNNSTDAVSALADGQNTVSTLAGGAEMRKGEIFVSAKQDGENIRLLFRDNGCGIDEKVQKEMFEPFFSTKNTTDNMGIGLNLCQSIVHHYNGEIFVDSVPGGYTEISILLPL